MLALIDVFAGLLIDFLFVFFACVPFQSPIGGMSIINNCHLALVMLFAVLVFSVYQIFTSLAGVKNVYSVY